MFILGRQADIALAELISFLKVRQIQYVPTRVGTNEIIIESSDSLGELQQFIDRLGGTIKIVFLDREVPLKNPSNFKEPLSELLKTDEIYKTYQAINDRKKSKKPRWTFGISVSAPGIKKNYHSELRRVIHGLALKSKKDLKSKNISSRYVAARGKSMNLSSVVVRKNKLNQDGGTDIFILATDGSIYRGKTVAVQDFEAYSKRDFGRPARNPRAGSLPPKLAQILINLTQLKPPAHILDPFVGQGTLLQEGALAGFEMSGSDVDEEQIGNSRRNLVWLQQQGLISQVPRVWQADVRQIKIDSSFSAIVTEGILGPPHSRPLSTDQARGLSERIGNIWHKLLKDVAAQAPGDFTIVCTWPVLQKRDGTYQFVNIIDDLADLGYSQSTILPDSLRDKKANGVAEQAFRERKTFIYSRPGQVVLREIIRLTKSK